MAEVIDFYKAKAELDSKTNSQEYESILDSPEYLSFLESCERLRRVSAELEKANLTYVKTNGEIL